MANRDGAQGSEGAVHDFSPYGVAGSLAGDSLAPSSASPEYSPRRLRKVCAWCQKRGRLTVIEEGAPGAPTSHGVCEKCAPAVMADTARAVGYRLRAHTLEPQRRSYHYGQTLGELEGWKGEIVVEVPPTCVDDGAALEMAKALAADELPGYEVLDWSIIREGSLVRLTPAEAEEVAR